MYFTLTLGCRVLHFAIKRAERKNVSEKLRCLGRTAKMFEKNKIIERLLGSRSRLFSRRNFAIKRAERKNGSEVDVLPA